MAFAAERNWDDNLVLSTVKLRYATMVFRTAFRTFGAKCKNNYRSRVVFVYRPVTFYLSNCSF